MERFIAGQLGHPSGVLGQLLLAPMWNRRNAALNEQALASLALQPTDRVLEIGFGGGYLLGRLLPQLRAGFLAGVDHSPAMVAFCRRRFRRELRAGNLALHCAPAEALPYPAASFTQVCSVNSVFYWPALGLALAECRRVLAESGRLVLCLTCREALQPRGFARHGLQLYEASELAAHLATSGFADIQTVSGADRHRRFVCLTGRVDQP